MMGTTLSLRSFARRILPCATLTLLAACATSEPPTEPVPAVVAVEGAEIVVGESLTLLAEHVPTDSPPWVRFEGIYREVDGAEAPVSASFAAVVDGEVVRGNETFTQVRISRLGPFGNPFARSDRPGRFVGQVTLEFETQDMRPLGAPPIDPAFAPIRRSRPLSAEIAVAPSLLIEAFEPLDAACGAPALRALPGLPYRLTVRPMGLKAVRFVYRVSHVNGVSGVVEFVHDLTGPVATDTLGIDEAVLFNPIDPDDQFYVASLRIFAYDAKGNEVETALPVSVHRPIEVLYDGERALAERFEPVPVSGCIPGSVNSRVSYSESRAETRQRSVSVTVSQRWASSQGQTVSNNLRQGVTEGESRSQTLAGTDREEELLSEGWGMDYTDSESNSVRITETDGESWSWNLSEGQSNTDYEDRMNELYGEGNWSGTVGVEASGSVPGFAKVTGRASTTVGVRAGGSLGAGSGGSQTESREQGFAMSGSRDESRSFGSATTEARSASLRGGFALSRGSERTVTEGQELESSRTWNLSEGASESELISEDEETARRLTLVDSTTELSEQGISGIIPRTKVGIFYRQTTRWVRRAEVRSYNLCGLARHMGELQFSDWTWAPELALADDCEEAAPPSSLPPAGCFVSPCEG